jgi:hypothetical protein
MVRGVLCREQAPGTINQEILALCQPSVLKVQSSRVQKFACPQLGKLLVFESGKVKLQMGGVLMDVSLGSKCLCAQHLMAVNVEGKSAMIVGEVAHRAVCTPDMDQLLG